jgi:uncharacterized protein with PIN domain
MIKVYTPKFIADAMLGTLAKRLRLLGIDTVYLNDAHNGELKYLTRSQDRILLTRDVNLAGVLGDHAWLVTGRGVREEFLSITERLAPFGDKIIPFSRCLDCNEPLTTIQASETGGKVPPYILSSKTHFSRCSSCGKVFWEGTHRKRMVEEVKWMREQLMD